jgi:surface carbohydrate biosynthesis protein
MNIYILLEIQKRELYSKILLSLEAAEKGNTVYLGKLTPFLKKDLFKPGIVHFKSITPGLDRVSEMKYLKKKNFLLTSLDEEHGIINNNKDYIKYRYSNITLDLIDYVFTWGKFDYNNLISKYHKYKNKFIKSGNPRVDFWRKDFLKFFSKSKNRKFNNYILLSANFEGFGHKTNKDVIRFHRKTGYFNRGASLNEMIARQKNSQKLFLEYEKTLKNMSRAFKNIQIIIRPHPKDNNKKWQKIFKKNKNIHIISDGNHSDWITNAKVVIHAGCTGGFESSIRNINTISYYPINVTHGHKFADYFSQKITNEACLFKEINKILSNSGNKIKLNNNLISNRIYNYNGKASYKIIVETWSKLSSKLISKKNNDLLLSFLFFLLKLKLIFLNIDTESYKFKKFSKSEVSEIVSRLISLNSRFSCVKIKFLSDHIIKFER